MKTGEWAAVIIVMMVVAVVVSLVTANITGNVISIQKPSANVNNCITACKKVCLNSFNTTTARNLCQSQCPSSCPKYDEVYTKDEVDNILYNITSSLNWNVDSLQTQINSLDSRLTQNINPSGASFCTDSDGGVNPTVYGITTLTRNGAVVSQMNDTCISQYILRDYICGTQNITYSDITCNRTFENRCTNGICVV